MCWQPYLNKEEKYFLDKWKIHFFYIQLLKFLSISKSIHYLLLLSLKFNIKLKTISITYKAIQNAHNNTHLQQYSIIMSYWQFSNWNTTTITYNATLMQVQGMQIHLNSFSGMSYTSNSNLHVDKLLPSLITLLCLTGVINFGEYEDKKSGD